LIVSNGSGSVAAGGSVPVSFGAALRFWSLLGWISFGGPAGQIAIMHRELVERRRWIDEDRFLHALNYCMLLPGPEAQQLATYVGWLLHGTAGGIAAGVLFVLPSVFILLGLSYLYAAYGTTASITGVLWGFKPVVVAIVAAALLRLGRSALRRRIDWGIAAAAFGAIYFFEIPFPLIILLAGLAGWAASRRRPLPAAPGDPNPPAPAAATSARAGGGAARPQWDRARFRARAARVSWIGAALWLAPLAALAAWRGGDSLHVQAYRFFTQAALVTFGGAYAVLSYVTQAAVSTYGWISHAEAIDGLALAETTPGPLIMVVQFVGFLAGWHHAEGMQPWASGVLGAAVTSYVTFLPCFLFIFLGAPAIEALRGQRRLRAALGSVTAAVVGVILNLALVFGAAVIWPHGLEGGPDGAALALGAAAFLPLRRWPLGVPWVVVGGGLIGLGRALWLG